MTSFKTPFGTTLSCHFVLEKAFAWGRCAPMCVHVCESQCVFCEIAKERKRDASSVMLLPAITDAVRRQNFYNNFAGETI